MRLFKEHPEEVGENYVEHLGTAASFSARMFVGSLICFVHGIFPFLFKKSGSRIVTDLHQRMVQSRSRLNCAAEQNADRAHEAA